MEVEIEYTVPVIVTVDIENGEVVRVVVDDERATPVICADPDYPAAVEIAEHADWPMWGFGT